MYLISIFFGLFHGSRHFDCLFLFCCGVNKLQTSESYLHFYRIQVSEKQLLSSIHNNLELPLVSVILSISVDAALYSRTVTVYCTTLIHYSKISMLHMKFALFESTPTGEWKIDGCGQ